MRRTVSVEILENRTLLAAVPVISGNGTTIANGDVTPDMADATDFSWAEMNGSLTRKYTIQNTGDASMTVSAPAISGANASAFTVLTAPAATVAAGQSTTFTLKFTPTIQGIYAATVDVHTDSPSIADYTFALAGKAIRTVVLAGGLRVGRISAGTGSQVVKGSLLTVNYTGWLRSDGTVFDSSLATGRTPFEFVIGASPSQVIQGWEKGMLGTRTGEHRVLFIPSALGYGSSGSGSIPGNADLVFDASLVSCQTLGAYFKRVSFSGLGHTIANHDSTWSATDATAFCSTGAAVTQSIVVDLSSSAITSISRFPVFVGSGASAFQTGGATNVGGQKYAISVTYTPIAGKVASDARMYFALNVLHSPTYSFAIHGEALASGVSFSGGALSVQGGLGSDSISLTRSGNRYRLRTNGVTNLFSTDSISSVALNGGGGDDLISVSSSVLLGVRIDGGEGQNTLSGGSGADTLLAGSGIDVLKGNAGNDSLDGGDGNNQLFGGAGNDALVGHNGNDTLDGGAGNDTLTGGAGNDRLIGRAGTNVFYAADGVADTIDCAGGVNNLGRWDEGIDTILHGALTLLP